MTDFIAGTPTYDLVIVGSGPNGAIVAHEVHRAAPSASILVVEAGGSISARAGEHLVEADDDAMRIAFETLMRRARQIEYVKGAVSLLGEGESWNRDDTGIFPAAFLGHDFAEFPGGSLAWNIGGMGVHWAAACPEPYGSEIPTELSAVEWARCATVARRLLRVNHAAFGPNPFNAPIIAALRAAVPASVDGREAQNMPLSGVQRQGGGSFARSGPRDIAPEVFDESVPHVRLRSRTLVSRILHRGGDVSGLVLRDVDTGTESEVGARAVVVAADTLRTPQLLWASGIRPTALGLRLNEHASIDGAVRVDAARFGLTDADVPVSEPGEPFIGAYWSPTIGAERPTHGQMMERVIDGEHSVGMSWYTYTDVSPDNRIEFSDERVDELGMPHMTARFRYSDADLERIQRLRGVQAKAAGALGEFTVSDSDTLPPGASLHYTGTVRMGASDDGTSVCGPDGRVWGLSNLFVAGNGVVPTALTCNSTLAGAVLSVHIAGATAAAIA